MSQFWNLVMHAKYYVIGIFTNMCSIHIKFIQTSMIGFCFKSSGLFTYLCNAKFILSKDHVSASIFKGKKKKKKSKRKMTVCEWR